MRVKDHRALIFTAVVLGILPTTLKFIGAPQYPLIGVLVTVNIFLCVIGVTTSYRILWIIYAAACVVIFILFGMSSPVSLVLTFLTG